MAANENRSLTQDRNFRLYLTGQSVSLMGSAMVPVTLGLVAAVTLHASGLSASLVSAGTLLPALLLMLPVGAIVDRLPKREAMMWADIAQSLTLWSIPVIWWCGKLSIGALCAVGFVATTCGIVSQVADLSLTPHLVEKERLIDANSRLSLADSVGTTAGPSLAGFLITRLGAPVALGLAAIGSLFSASTLAGVTSNEPPTERPAGMRSMVNDIAEGLRFVMQNVRLRTLMLINATDNFFLAWIEAVVMVYYIRSLHWSAQALGLVLGIAAIGGIIGSLFVKRLHRLLGTERLLVAAVVVGAPTESVVLVLRPGLAGQVLACCAQFLAVLGTTCYNVTSRTLRQNESPEGMRSRITAAHRWVGNGLQPVGALTGGLATTAFGLWGGILFGCVGLLGAPTIAFTSPLLGRDGGQPEPAEPDTAGQLIDAKSP